MKEQTLSMACVGVLCFSLVASAQTGASHAQAVEQELIALDKKFDEARRVGDAAFVAEVLSDSFLQVVGITVRTKADVLKALTAAKPLPPGLPEPPAPTYTVRISGDTAVMTHVTRWTDPHEPRPSTAVMHTFVREQGRWKMIGWSSTPAPPATEQSINFAAYEVLGRGKTKEAIELLKMNVQLFPASWNAYDSLGEAYAAAGETALAIQNYEKSLQLNPQNELGRAALAKLKK